MPVNRDTASEAISPLRGRVFIVNRYLFPDESATSQIASDLAFYIANQGITVIGVASRLRYDDPASLLSARETIGKLQVDRLATTRFGRARLAGRVVDYLSFYFSALAYLVRHLRRGDIVICKTDPPMLSVVGAVAAWLRGAKLVNWLQDIYPEIAVKLGVLRLPKVMVAALHAARNRSLAIAHANIVIGRRMRDHLLAQGLDEARICVIPNWNRDIVQPVMDQSQTLRRSWGYGCGDLVIGYSGNLGRGHDYQVVIDAALSLIEHRHIKFLMVGGGAGMADFRTRVDRLGLKNVQFQPYQPIDRLAETLSVPDIHWVTLKPALEGLLLPSKVYGIAAVGRPFIFIGAPDGEHAGLAREFDAGFAVQPDDKEALVALLLRLDYNHDLLLTMGANARNMLGSFSAERSLAMWDRVLREIDGTG